MMTSSGPCLYTVEAVDLYYICTSRWMMTSSDPCLYKVEAVDLYYICTSRLNNDDIIWPMSLHSTVEAVDLYYICTDIQVAYWDSCICEF